ncbi:hypothetical protein WA026_015079 [Henosepilachna vigintioctopunctata]|uniref:Uncharacterized protein n=1 Tax=Henosepilachna vigintioctopunctata TaxID=420089 RepID=A0AAW1U8A7_9CUCU
MLRPTIHTYNGRSSLEDKRKENIYSGLHSANCHRLGERDLPSDFFDSDDTETSYRFDPSKYHSFNRYNAPKSYDNWSYNTLTMLGSHRSSLPNTDKYAHRMSSSNTENKYTRRSLNRYSKNAKPRPRPLQADNQKYYDHVFPKPRDLKIQSSNFHYQPGSLDKAEL